MATGFVQTNLVSDMPGVAVTQDPNLVNPWGLTASPTSAAWISNNNSGTSTLYNPEGGIVPLVVKIPTNTPGVLGSPTGIVSNPLAAVKPPLAQAFDVSEIVNGVKKTGASAFIFDTEDGFIAGWAPGVDRNNAIMAINNPNASYKGLALEMTGATTARIYAANFQPDGGSIDVYDQGFQAVHLSATAFHDPNIPTGYAPFNIQDIGGKLYVTYAKFDPATTEGLPGGGGFVDVYDINGNLLTTAHPLISNGPLNAPWGITVAPASFGSLGGDLLVGNFGNGRINAFDPTSGQFLGALRLTDGRPFQVTDLWALRFGNGGGMGSTNTLFFTAGLKNQADGIYGSLQATAPVSDATPVVSSLPSAAEQTVPTNDANGDQNPYGVAFVPRDIRPGGVLQPGDLLVSNFNDHTNTQGTGSTIELVTPQGGHSTFFQGAPGQSLGLTTALGVLSSGFVLVGNVPVDANGNPQQGSLLVLDSNGKQVAELTDPKLLDGPWDLTINDEHYFAQVFVSNVLSGTVTRIDLITPPDHTPIVIGMTQIASGYAHRLDPNALVVGPTGLAFDPRSDTLYVASTADNAIFAVPNAAITRRDHGTGSIVFDDQSQLHGPLALVLLPNGDLLTSNGDAVNPGGTPNNLVEFTPTGRFVGTFQIDSGSAGAAFGLAVSTDGGVLRLAAADDNADPLLGKSNTVKIFTLPLQRTHHHHHDFGG